MPTLPSPAFLLAALILAIAGFGGGCYLGYDYRGGVESERVAEAQNEALERAREDAAAAIIAMAEAGRKNGLAEAAARQARTRGVTDANIKANSACDRDAESVGLLNDAIERANGAPDHAAGVPEEVRSDAEARRWLGPIFARLGVRGD
jgi:hypothetical protein